MTVERNPSVLLVEDESPLQQTLSRSPRVRELTPFGVLHKPFPIDALLRLIHMAAAEPEPAAQADCSRSVSTHAVRP